MDILGVSSNLLRLSQRGSPLPPSKGVEFWPPCEGFQRLSCLVGQWSARFSRLANCRTSYVLPRKWYNNERYSRCKCFGTSTKGPFLYPGSSRPQCCPPREYVSIEELLTRCPSQAQDSGKDLSSVYLFWVGKGLGN